MQKQLNDGEVRNILARYLASASGPRSTDTKTSEVVEESRKLYVQFEQMLLNTVAYVEGDLLEFFKTRTLTDQDEGDWITNPSGVVAGDDGVFSKDARGVGGTSIAINVCLDCSASMSVADGLDYSFQGGYTVNPLGTENPMFIAPRIFYTSMCMRVLYKGLTAYIESTGLENAKVRMFTFANGYRGQEVYPYGGGVWYEHPVSGGSTPLLPIYKAIEQVESDDNLSNCNSLDIFIGDGEFNSTGPSAIEEINRIQESRQQVSSSLNSAFILLTPRYEKGSVIADNVLCSTSYTTKTPQILATLVSQLLSELFIAQ